MERAMGDGGRENQDTSGGINLRLEDAPSSSEEGRKGGGEEDKDVEAFTVGRARKAFNFSLAV